MKQALGTLALMSLFAFVGLTGPAFEASAATDVNVVYGSSATSRVVVSTGTPIRIDNWSNGKGALLLSNRIGLQWQNLDAADNIWCSNASNVSTHTASSTVGFKYAAGVFASEGLPRDLQEWCQCDDAGGAAGCVIVTRQVGAR